MKKFARDLWQTNGRWSGGKIGAWGAGGTIIAGEIYRVFLLHADPDWTTFASAVLAVGGMIVGDHYMTKKADHKFGSSTEGQDK